MSTGSISRWVLRHKAVVGVFWIAVTVAAIALMPWVSDSYSENFGTSGTESEDMALEATRIYGNDGSFAPIVLVAQLPEGQTVDSPGVKDAWLGIEQAVQAAEPRARIVTWGSTGDDTLVSEDRRTMMGLVYLPLQGAMLAGQPEVVAALEGATVGEAPVLMTGRPVLETEGGGEQDNSVLIETLVGGLGALIVLLYVFGSALALMPLLVAAVSILTSFLVIGILAQVLDITSIVQFIVALIGLGVAIDYSLLVVKRWREERLAGKPNQEAVQIAMETAGHAAVFSGTTVGVGLLGLMVIPISFFVGMGVGGMVIPLASVVVTLTLLPVILATVGPRLDRIGWHTNRPEDHRGWERWARLVVRNRWQSAAIGLILLVALSIPALLISAGPPKPDSLNSHGDPRAGLHLLEDTGFSAGSIDTLTILVQGDPAAIVSAVEGLDGVRGAVAPTGDSWSREGTSLVVVIPQGSGENSGARDLVDRVRDSVHGIDSTAMVGGGPAGSADFVEVLYDGFPLMIVAVAVITYILLVRAFRSLLLPLKALFLNVLSVAASYGVMVMIWQWGWGSDLVWGIPSTGSITEWVPIATFAFLFGLSMDYEVFIMHRMREEYDSGHSTDEAIVRGLAFTGKLVTCAALILFLAFVAMASTPQTEIKIMATGLAAGIIIDATVIRAFLVPALTSLMGKWNWWLPSSLTWIAPKEETRIA